MMTVSFHFLLVAEMLIREKDIENTASFIVAEFRRNRKANPQRTNQLARDARLELSGLSKLLIGRREKSHVELALQAIDRITQKQAS